MFDRLIWKPDCVKPDRMLLDDLVFRLEFFKNDDWELGNECFGIYKDKELVDVYQRFWVPRTDFRVKNIFELGIYDGGSIAFWFEYFHPQKYVAIDLLDREDSDYFRRYLSTREIEDRIRTYWRVDQGDQQRLKEIVRTEFDSSLDMVIDDASHEYTLTKTSFEVLFPMLRPGGLYFIEDWDWAHRAGWLSADSPFAGKVELTRLVFDLVEAAGTSGELISSLMIFRGLAVVERGPKKLNLWRSLCLEDHILRRPMQQDTTQKENSQEVITQEVIAQEDIP
jgi:hypothetical protein